MNASTPVRLPAPSPLWIGARVQIGAADECMRGVMVGRGVYFDGVPGIWIALEGTRQRQGCDPLTVMVPVSECVAL